MKINKKEEVMWERKKKNDCDVIIFLSQVQNLWVSVSLHTAQLSS